MWFARCGDEHWHSFEFRVYQTTESLKFYPPSCYVDSPLTMVGASVAAFNARDAQAAAALYHDNGTNWQVAAGDPIIGRQAVLQELLSFFRAFPDRPALQIPRKTSLRGSSRDLIVSGADELQEAEPVPEGIAHHTDTAPREGLNFTFKLGPAASARCTAASTSFTSKSRCTGVQWRR